MNKALSKTQFKTGLKSLNSEWQLNSAGTSISRKFSFGSYLAGLMFVTKISIHAEVALHHPEILFNYNSVKITLTTHDAKGLTKVDFSMAQQFDTLYLLSTTSVKNIHSHY